jgi:hypothetical protein
LRRSPLIVITFSSTVTLTSSLLTSGSSVLMRYSVSVSEMFAAGAQADSSAPEPARAAARPNSGL